MNKFDNNSPFRNVIFRNDSKKGIRKGVEITTECVCVCVRAWNKEIERMTSLNLVYRVPLNCPRWNKNCKVDGIVTGDSFLSC